MITKDNLKEVLEILGFSKNGNIFSKNYTCGGAIISINFVDEKIIYPSEIKKGDETTCNFSHNENFVVLECVNRLLEKGYKPEHIEIEPRFKLGKESKTSGKADILVKNQRNETYIIIECKTFGPEFSKEWKNMQSDGGQLFSYFQQDKSAEFLCLYASDFDEKIITEQKIINVKDNEVFLKEKEKTGYEKAKSVKDLYNVWKEVYEFDCSTTGIFEENINAYNAGKLALSWVDLKEFSKKDQEGKYHEFAKILRKHNISGKENAFDKLVNLFLCKIYDEIHNAKNLQFGYRGIMSDSYENLQDRLMVLYKKAMEKYLNEEITYVSDGDIDKQFEDFESNKIETKKLKEQMQEFIRQLKFYSHSDFSFLEVHKKELFIKNGAVLKEVVELFQNYKLTQNKTNQFLSELFELFLQKGMKQDEGQFFTPLQICEFIMHSLPLANMLENKIDLKVIDYACGAGHFLNIYANTAKQIAPNHKSQIYGIEKEYRLSKVSKVSSAMYNHDINFTYADALDKSKFEIKNFDLLIANPPYSVKGFLETLSTKIKENYELFSSDLNEQTNTIECFFIERANDILKSGAKAAIILPSSILNKDGIYAKTRAIILRNFDIISICELPSGTFGATGTNTIILFLTKKPTYESSPNSQSYENLFDNIENSLSFGNLYLREFLEKYCEFLGFDINAYSNFLIGNLSDELLETELFRDYQNDFENSKELKNLENSKIYKESKEQSKLKAFEFHNFAIAKEKERFLYFSLVNEQKTLVIKAPSDNKEQKKFLGYEWSNRKGDEGLKELNNPYLSPLFERENINNTNKLAFLIKSNFLGQNATISPECEEFATLSPLTALIDFKRSEFSNAINLSLAVVNNINITSPFENSRFELVRLGEICEIKNGVNVKQSTEIAKYKVSRIETIAEAKFNIKAVRYTNDEVKDENFLQKGDILFSHINSVSHLGKTAIFELDEKVIHGINLLRFRIFDKKTLSKFLLYVLKTKNLILFVQSNATKAVHQASVNTTFLKNIKIPLPPLDIQKQIVAECESVENENSRILNEIAEQQEQINAILAKTGILNVEFKDNENLKDLPTPQDYNLTEWESVKLDEVSDIIRGVTYDKKEQSLNKTNNAILTADNITLENNFEISKVIYLNDSVKLDDKKKLSKNDIFMCFASGSLLHVGKVAYIENDTEFYAGGFMGILRSKNINSKFLFSAIANNDFKKKLEQSATGSNINNLSSKISFLQIPLPPLDAQEKIVQAIESIEQKISSLQTELNSLKGKQKEILDKYLF